ncbi:MAG: hypothetical protein ACXWQO_02450 [Bdellovibrionota bacterium]
MKTFLHAILFASALSGAVTILAAKITQAHDYHQPAGSTSVSLKDNNALVPDVDISGADSKTLYEGSEADPIARPDYKTKLSQPKLPRSF